MFWSGFDQVFQSPPLDFHYSWPWQHIMRFILEKNEASGHVKDRRRCVRSKRLSPADEYPNVWNFQNVFKILKKNNAAKPWQDITEISSFSWLSTVWQQKPLWVNILLVLKYCFMCQSLIDIYIYIFLF